MQTYEAKMHNISRACSEFYGIPVEDLFTQDKLGKKTSEARNVAMALSYTYTREKMSVIGEFFGRDHSTVSCAHKRVKEHCEEKQELLDKVTAVAIRSGVVV